MLWLIVAELLGDLIMNKESGRMRDSKLYKTCSDILGKLLNPPPMVAVLSLHGVIGTAGKFRGDNVNADMLEPYIKKAFTLPRLKAVALAINSPGGAPVQSMLIFNMIRHYAAKYDVPVLAFIEDVGASGGYMLALAGDEIFAMEASIVGSIGVVASGFGFHEFIKKHGIERRIYTQGKSKAMLDPFLPEKESDVKQLKAAQADVFASFKELVQKRRGDKLPSKTTDLFTGAIWSGVKAKKLGLIDDIGDVRSVCLQRFGEDIQLKYLRPNKGFLAKRLGVLHPEYWVDAIIDRLAAQLAWQRFGC